MAACSGELPYLTARREAGSCETLALFSVGTELSPGAGGEDPDVSCSHTNVPSFPTLPSSSPGPGFRAQIVQVPSPGGLRRTHLLTSAQAAYDCSHGNCLSPCEQLKCVYC